MDTLPDRQRGKHGVLVPRKLARWRKYAVLAPRNVRRWHKYAVIEPRNIPRRHKYAVLEPRNVRRWHKYAAFGPRELAQCLDYAVSGTLSEEKCAQGEASSLSDFARDRRGWNVLKGEMAARFVNIDHDTPLLLPPDLRDWLPAGHLVHFVMDAVEQLDLRMAQVNERGTGDAQYPPPMMLGLLIYSYATGNFGSRQIERATHENVAARLLCGDTHPDHDTICTFRRNNRALLGESFAQVLELAARCGVLKVGGITVAIDGTKVLADASKHAAVSYERAGAQLRELDLEVEELLRKAEQADSTPLEDGLSIPAEVQRRQERKAQLAKARAEMEARAYARAQAERPDYERRQAARDAARAEGKSPAAKIRSPRRIPLGRKTSSTSPIRRAGS